MQPFDIYSCSKIDMDNFSWATSHNIYQDLRKLIINSLNEWGNLHDPDKFNIILSQLTKALTEYVTIFYDIKKVKNHNKIKYDKINNHFINNILEKKETNEIYNFDLELKRVPKKKFNFLLSKFYLSFGSIFKKELIISKNESIENYLKKNQNNIYIPPIYFLNTPSKIKKENDSNLNYLVNTILEKLVVYDKVFEKIISKNIENILRIYFNRLNKDIDNLNSLKYLLKPFKIIISGTGDQYFNQLMSYYAKMNNIFNYRFDHGGEKSFFIDREFWKSEIQYIDKYFTYSSKISDSYKKIFQNNDINYSGSFGVISSQKLKKISDSKIASSLEDPNTLIYVQQAFVGNSRNVDSKLNDPLLYYWQYNLLKNLNKRGYKVIFKKHPKSVSNLTSLYEKAFKTYDKSFDGLFDKNNIFLFDSAGSAFIEAMVARRKIILLDNSIRKVNNDQFYDIMEYATVIKGFWKNNLPMVDFDNLCHEIEKLKIKNIQFNQTFYEKFYNK